MTVPRSRRSRPAAQMRATLHRTPSPGFEERHSRERQA
jgi:hypothetical protein